MGGSLGNSESGNSQNPRTRCDKRKEIANKSQWHFGLEIREPIETRRGAVNARLQISLEGSRNVGCRMNVRIESINKY